MERIKPGREKTGSINTLDLLNVQSYVNHLFTHNPMKLAGGYSAFALGYPMSFVT